MSQRTLGKNSPLFYFADHLLNMDNKSEKIIETAIPAITFIGPADACLSNLSATLCFLISEARPDCALQSRI